MLGALNVLGLYNSCHVCITCVTFIYDMLIFIKNMKEYMYLNRVYVYINTLNALNALNILLKEFFFYTFTVSY